MLLHRFGVSHMKFEAVLVELRALTKLSSGSPFPPEFAGTTWLAHLVELVPILL